MVNLAWKSACGISFGPLQAVSIRESFQARSDFGF